MNNDRDGNDDYDKKYFMGFPSEKYLFLHKGHLKCQENISVFFLPKNTVKSYPFYRGW